MAITTEKVYKCICDTCGFTRDVKSNHCTRFIDVMTVLRNDGWRVSYGGRKCTCPKCGAHYGKRA